MLKLVPLLSGRDKAQSDCRRQQRLLRGGLIGSQISKHLFFSSGKVNSHNLETKKATLFSVAFRYQMILRKYYSRWLLSIQAVLECVCSRSVMRSIDASSPASSHAGRASLAVLSTVSLSTASLRTISIAFG